MIKIIAFSAGLFFIFLAVCRQPLLLTATIKNDI